MFRGPGCSCGARLLLGRHWSGHRLGRGRAEGEGAWGPGTRRCGSSAASRRVRAAVVGTGLGLAAAAWTAVRSIERSGSGLDDWLDVMLFPWGPLRNLHLPHAYFGRFAYVAFAHQGELVPEPVHGAPGDRARRADASAVSRTRRGSGTLSRWTSGSCSEPCGSSTAEIPRSSPPHATRSAPRPANAGTSTSPRA